MKDQLRARDITVKMNGVGFIVEIGDRSERLMPVEAESLFEQLLKTLPGISNRVELAWNHRHDPWIKLIGYYALEGDEIKVKNWKGEVYICGERAFYTKGFMEKDEAADELRRLYGKDLLVRKEEVYEVSKKKAEEQLTIKKATEYAAANGMTLDELWKEAMNKRKAGEI